VQVIFLVIVHGFLKCRHHEELRGWNARIKAGTNDHVSATQEGKIQFGSAYSAPEASQPQTHPKQTMRREENQKPRGR
jgi:Tfp pilus assembly protein PilP